MVRPAPRLSCRQITEADFEPAVALLCRGFPERQPAYWRRALSRLHNRTCPEGMPRYGYVLTQDTDLVGILLLIVSVADDGSLRANVSSWYVDPDMRGYSNVLLSRLFRLKDVTVVNISPARNTSDTIKAQGYTRYGADGIIACAAFKPFRRGVRVKRVRDASEDTSKIIRDHIAYDTLCYDVTDGDVRQSFIFSRDRILGGRVPCAQLLYAPDLATLARYAGPLGRSLLREGLPFILFDSNGQVPGLSGLLRKDRNPRYFRGPNPPRLGDLAYTELAIFGR